MRGRMRERGFSALEALIAAAILAVALIPLLSLQQQAVRQAARVEELHAGLSAQRSAIDLLTTVNPMAEPVGERALSATMTMRWRAAPISPVKRGVAYLAGPGPFEVALYRLEVVVEADGRMIRTFTLDQVGWRPRGA